MATIDCTVLLSDEISLSHKSILSLQLFHSLRERFVHNLSPICLLFNQNPYKSDQFNGRPADYLFLLLFNWISIVVRTLKLIKVFAIN